MNTTAVIMFLLFVAATLVVTWWAANRTRDARDFYVAGGRITGLQNGAAIAGDFMSAASFLGITALIFSFGFDGLVLALGAFAGWPFMLFLLARRVRNLGSCTFSDVVSQRLARGPTRLVGVLGTVVVTILYLIAQMVGAGKLVELLFGLPYSAAIVTVSLLILLYVSFGGMLATTWVQIIKAALLLSGATILALLVYRAADWDLTVLFTGVADRHRFSGAALFPGTLFKDPIQVLTIMCSMLFGVLGLPHILMRLFTVPDMHEAKKSTFFASLFMGYFYLLMIFIGFGTIFVLNGDARFFDSDGMLVGGGNMAAIHLSSALGGDLLTGFMSAVCFATILAVVSGLTVSGAAAIAHDFYAELLCRGEPDPRTELRITRIATLAIGILAVLLGLAFENENIAFIATMPNVVAASVTFPVLLLSLYWGGLTTRGAVAGALVGLASSVGLIVVGPQVWGSVLDLGEPLFPYDYPALFTMPLAFATAWLLSATDRSQRGELDRANYHRLLLRSELGEAAADALQSPARSQR